MRHRRALVAVLSAVALLAPALLTVDAVAAGARTAPAAAAATPAAQLHREGRWLVDPQGRVVLLHGVNAVWKTPPYCAPDTAAGFTAADARWLADHGFNTVRLGVLFAGVMPERGWISAGYLDCVGRIVDLLAGEHIWVLLDSHQDLYNERFGGEGFPDWSVYDDGLPPPSGPLDIGFPGNYFMPATSRAFDNLYANRAGVADEFAAAWRAVAQRFRESPYLLGYDLLNEPFPGTQGLTCFNPLGCPLFDSLSLQPFYERVRAAIRSVDASHVLWIEPNVLFNDDAATNLATLRPLPRDANYGLSWHDYCLIRGSAICPPLVEHVFDNAETAVRRIGAATLLSEFGSTDDLDTLTRMTGLADEHLVSWQYWHYKSWADPTTVGGTEAQSLFTDDADLASVKIGKLRVLERAYPQATAGVPTQLSFDPVSGLFRYAYTPRPAAGPTVIFVPPLHYPHGYDVAVHGATVTSQPDAPQLILQAVPGATSVVVELTARSADRPG